MEHSRVTETENGHCMRYGILLIAFIYAACGQTAPTDEDNQTTDVAVTTDTPAVDTNGSTGTDGAADTVTEDGAKPPEDTGTTTGSDVSPKEETAGPSKDVPEKDLCESVKCKAVDNPCLKELNCDPATGDCTVEVPREAGAACEPDDNPCTSHSCDGLGGCVASEKSTVGDDCDDKSECSINDVCTQVGDEVQCIGDAVDVNDKNPCTFDACVDGKVMHTPINGATCNPENECAGSGVCSKGECIKNKKCA